MPNSSNKLNNNSASGNSLADLSDAIIAAIETGYANVSAQSQSGSAAAPIAGASAAAVSSIIEPSGGVGGAGQGVAPGAVAPAESPVIEPTGGIVPPPNPHQGGAYEAAKAQRDEIESHLKDTYAGRGDFAKIGGEGYKDELQEELEKEGLAQGKEKRGFFASKAEIKEKFTSGLFEEGVGIGYPAIEMATGLSKRIEKQDSGQYVSPEERQHSLAEAALPGGGGIAGAILGTLVPAIGPVLGGFGGQSIGEVSASVIGAKSEKDETTREAAERLANSLGRAEEAVHSFRSQIEATGAPVAQVAQGLSILENSGAIGGNGSQVIAGQGKMALGLGEQFGAVDTAIAQTLASDPALYQASGAFQSKGILSSSEFRNIGKYELLEGNGAAYTEFQQASAAARYTSDPEASKLMKDEGDTKTSWWGQAVHTLSSTNKYLNDHLGILSPLLAPLGGIVPSDPVEEAAKATDARKKVLDDKAKDDAKDDLNDSIERGAANFSVLTAASSVNRQIGEYRYAALGSDTPLDLAKRLPGLKSSLDQEAAADQSMIEADQRELAKIPANSPANISARSGYQLEISKLEDDKIEKPDLFYRQFVAENYKSQIEESGATSSLAETRATIEGKSASEIERIVDRQSSYLVGMARAPQNPLSPEEAAGIEQGAAKARYSAMIETQAQSLSVKDERIEQAGFGVTQAQISGGPQEVSQARGREIEDYRAKITELSTELQRGGLSVDDAIAKERQLTSTRAEAAKAVDAQAQGRFSENFSLDARLESTAQIGLGRRIERSGNAGTGADALSLNLTEQTEAQSHLDFDRRNTPKNLSRIADDEGRLRQVQDERDQLLDQTNTYHPSGAVSRKLASDKADFQISMISPYQDGNPENDPITRNRAVLEDVRQDMAGNESNRRRGLAQNQLHPGSWRDEDETRYNERRNADRLEIAQVEAQQRTAYESMLPEMLAGSPGAGRLTGILPTAGQAAYFNPNGFMTGSFGKPNLHLTDDGEGHTPQAGGQVGAFLAATGGAAARALMNGNGTSGDTGPAILAELRRLNANVERANSGSTRSPVMTSGKTGGVNPYEYNGGGGM